MTCNWEDRNSLCMLDAKNTVTYGETGKQKTLHLCPECTNMLWDMVVAKVRTGSVEWQQKPVAKNG